jgi:uncharacterized protein with HEPN domain
VSKDNTVYLSHILECISRINTYVEPGRDWFLQDQKTQDAVTRNLEIIGQAVKDMDTAQLVLSHPDVPWRQIADTRNVLAHQYLGVDNVLIWNIIEHELPALKQTVSELLQHIHPD